MPAKSKMFRIPLRDSDRRRLEELLADVPTETVVRFDWKSEEGRLFIKELRKIQLSGVPANWIAEELDVSISALNGALSYWERRTNQRNPRSRSRRRTRTPRPVSTPEEEAG